MQQGEKYQCTNEECGCQISVTKASQLEETQAENPTCCCGGGDGVDGIGSARRVEERARLALARGEGDPLERSRIKTGGSRCSLRAARLNSLQ